MVGFWEIEFNEVSGEVLQKSPLSFLSPLLFGMCIITIIALSCLSIRLLHLITYDLPHIS